MADSNRPKLLIELQSDNSVTVTGPIGNLFLCYGMLEQAKDAIRDHVARQAQKIAVAQPHEVPQQDPFLLHR